MSDNVGSFDITPEIKRFDLLRISPKGDNQEQKKSLLADSLDGRLKWFFEQDGSVIFLSKQWPYLISKI